MRGVPARPVTRTSHTGHSHSRLDHASALANRNAATAAPSPAVATHALTGQQPPRAQACPAMTAAAGETARLAVFPPGPADLLTRPPGLTTLLIPACVMRWTSASQTLSRLSLLRQVTARPNPERCEPQENILDRRLGEVKVGVGARHGRVQIISL
jgi:hypothetical protein